ncbi:AAA family ATPase [Ornithinibacillus xuwenensis]|uniref:Nuclease SbcCD subunit C n=1 Tax=Ornithinibacillus xuwenensis TaxID=3144668 RepID=A0ABU9XFE3_9BACI
MRALSLSLTAFGPYLEKQVINFEELGDETIFLITGPTGAGKTTIFDGICYALYGKASGSDRDQDSLRSHFAANDEPTEVQFRFALNQKEYEIIRHPKQQKKKERGEGFTDEPAKAILYEIINGERELISSRIKDVNETIESKLGFDYEQFRKMVLIPQGEFRKLISENSREREAILQKIFRTHFYEKITDELKLKAKELEGNIKQFEADLNYEFSKVYWQYISIEESDSDAIRAEKLSQEIEQTKKQLDNHNQVKATQLENIKMVEEKLRNARLIEEKFKEQETLRTELTQLEKDSETITTQKKKLKQAQIAQQIIPLEEQSNARNVEWHNQLKRLNEQEKIVKHKQGEYESIVIRFQEAQAKETEREQLKESIKLAKNQLEQVNSYLILKQQVEEIWKDKEIQQSSLKQVEEKQQALETALQEIERKLEEENPLTKTYYETKEQLNKLDELMKKLSKLSSETKRLLHLRQEYSVIHRTYQEKQQELKEIKMKYDMLETKQKEQFAALLAHKLIPGEPCPVCGSLEHPDKALHAEVDNDFNEMEQLKIAIQKKENEVETYQQTYLDHTSKGQTQRHEVEKLQEELNDVLPEEITEATITEVMSHVENRINNSKKQLTEITEKLEVISLLKQQREEMKRTSTELKQTFEQLYRAIQISQEELVRTRTQIEEMEKQLPEDIADPRAFAEALREKEANYQRLMKEWEQLKSAYEASHESLQKEKTVLEQLRSFEEETKKNYYVQHEGFLNAVQNAGFLSQEAYTVAKLPIADQAKMEEEIQAYENRAKQIRYRLEELQEQLSQVERINLAELEALMESYNKQLQEINDTLFAMNAKAKQDESIQREVSRITARQKELESEYYIIGNLSDLSSGNNALRLSFERYVLASFLDEILLQANIRFDRMTEHRYQLIRSGEVAKRGAQSGLDLEVMDHHTGITRSVKTLSGGEGFKAALSLALGLADVVQAHAGGVQLDTLFIDEGFGTLDEISLQQAIDCLKDLQESNRLLGIISHVPQLKNEIHTKLTISPSHKGSNLRFTFGN